MFNSIGALFAAPSIASLAQDYAHHDAMLICKGKSFQWVSLSTYNQTGKLKVIEPPLDAPPAAKHVKCMYSYLADNNSDDDMSFEQLPVTETALVFSITQYIEFFLATPKHKLASTRAPPFFS
jgi:hypothetical protein